MKFRWRYLGVGLLVLLVLLAIVLLNASSWLESASGRNLLQRELGKALGLQASLQGDYSLRLFPAIQIAGNELILSDVGTGHTLANIQAYELKLALRPLLRKQIDILKVAIDGGRLDLDIVAELGSATSSSGPAMQLPKIRDLEISGLTLQKSAADFLLISQLNMTGFADNQKSQMVLDLAFPLSDDESGMLSVEGYVQLSASPFQLLLDVQQLNVQLAGQSWNAGEGELSWSAEKDELTGELNGLLAGYSSKYQFSVHMAEALRIVLSVELFSAGTGKIAASLEAFDVSNNWLLDPVILNLDGQELAGSGCLSTEGEPVLQLQLDANRLDLDALQALLPTELLATGPGVEAGNGAAESFDELDLPMQLAIALTADELRMSGATARNARVLLGAEPDCSPASDQALN